MIYTLTLNPALDYVTFVDDFNVGNIMRSVGEKVFFGGKGINVSSVLLELGVSSVAMGFLAGFTGKAIEQGLNDKGVSSDFVYLKNGFSRINIKIRSGTETDINGQGPEISVEDFNLLLKKLEKLKLGDMLVLAGSIPPSLPQNTYEQIMKKLQDKDVRFVVDATGELLLSSLKYKPFLIKPNLEELEELFKSKISSKNDIEKYALRLQGMGAQNVLVSLGGDGAVLLDENQNTHYQKAFSGKVINTVGAGDSMVAGFIAGYFKEGDYSYALKLGSASGSATAFSEGLANKQTIKDLLN